MCLFEIPVNRVCGTMDSFLNMARSGQFPGMFSLLCRIDYQFFNFYRKVDKLEDSLD